MNHTIATLLSTTLVSTGVVAELNLIRIFVNDWREGRRDKARRRLRPAATGQSPATTLGIGRSRRVHAAAALVCGVMPSAALAQQSSTPPESAASAGVTPDAPHVGHQASLLTRGFPFASPPTTVVGQLRWFYNTPVPVGL
jgi:hypothetical protein